MSEQIRRGNSSEEGLDSIQERLEGKDLEEELRELRWQRAIVGDALNQVGETAEEDKYDRTFREVMEEVREELDQEIIFYDAEGLEEGLTNDLAHDGEVLIKSYNSTAENFKGLSFTPVFAFVANTLKGDPSWPYMEDRMDNEEEFKEEIQGLENVKVPEVYGRRGDKIFYELIDGENAKATIEEHPETGFIIGKKIGEALSEMTENGLYQTDSRPVNWMPVFEGEPSAESDPEICVVDQEYSSRDRGNLLDIDAFMFNDGMHHFDFEDYRNIIEGFEEGYGEEIRLRNNILRSAISPFHAVLLEKDFGWMKNSLKNTGKGAYNALS